MDGDTPDAARPPVAGGIGPAPDAGGAAPDAGADLPPGTAVGASDRFARNLAETSGAMFLYASISGVFRGTDAAAYKMYRDQLVADCGSPHDPVEVMLIEQLALAHLNAGRLHFRAANAESLEGARVYGGLAVLLQGELRRTALALKAYRSQARPQVVAAEDQPGDGNGAAVASVPVRNQKSGRRRTG